MADLEAELLALAGDSDEDSDEQQQQQAPSTQQAPADLESGEESEGEDRSQSRSKTAPKGRSRKTDDDNDDAASDQSADMSESAGSIPDDDNLQSRKYPVEGKFKSEKDRAAIMALPEIEREQILADRADELAKEDEERRLRALLHSYKSSNKRKASESDLRDVRKTSRVKTQKDKSLDELRRKREERGAPKSGQANRIRRSVSAELDSDGESEPEWGSDDRRREKTPEERPVNLRDYERLKIGYQNFARVCFYPHFEDRIVGCYVRLSVGSEPRHKVYRMAKIEGIVERHPYAMDSSAGNGRKFITTQHVLASIGKSKREWSFLVCSQGPFTQKELDDYQATLRNDNMPLPSLSRLSAKLEDINTLIGHKFTERELGEKVNRSQVLQDRYRQHKKAGLEKEKERAERDEDQDALARINRQLETVMKDALNLRYGTSMPQAAHPASPLKKTGEMNQQQRLAQLNKERAKADQQRIRNALLEESRPADRRRKANNAGAVDGISTPVNGNRVSAVKPEPANDDTTDAVKIVNGKPMHNLFSATDDLELPRPEWSFNYVEYSNKYLGSRSMHHLTYDENGRAKTEWARQMTDDEVIARMDIPMPLIAEY